MQSIGVFTSVGLNVGQTMGSLRTSLTRFQEVSLFSFSGQPLVAAPTPILTDVALGLDRLITMGAHALAECARGCEAEALPLLLCAPADDELALNADALFDGICEHASVAIDRTASKIVTGGHAAVASALVQADALLQSGRASACYVGGVDSMLDLDRLTGLDQAQRLLHAANPDGFIPGEAAAFVRVARRAERGALAWVRGVALGDEPAARGSGPPNQGVGLARAMKAALADAGAAIEDVALLVQDVTGERAAFYESSLALARLRPRRKGRMETTTLALCVGEVGAALGPLSLAYLAFLLRAGAVEVPADLRPRSPAAMYAGTSDGRLRGAVFLSEVRHG